MSFKCQKCNKPQAAGVRPVRIITKMRKVLHENKYPGAQILKEENRCEKCVNT